MTTQALSLLPIDVGWDPRVLDDCHVRLPTNGKLEIRYLGRDGEPKTVRGEYKHAARMLRAAGYKVKPSTEEAP